MFQRIKLNRIVSLSKGSSACRQSPSRGVGENGGMGEGEERNASAEERAKLDSMEP